MPGPFLWHFSVRIAAEAEEPAAALLERLFGQTSSIEVDARTSVTRAGVYLPKRPAPRTLTEFRKALRQLKQSGLKIGPEKISLRKIHRENWSQSWKRHFQPLEIGTALLIKPGWSKRRPKPGQAVVTLDPGLSFGTGQHPTTRFCLEQLVSFRRERIAQSCLDIGTGSGILAIAAAKLGYAPVIGIDSDPEAIRIARSNARRNRVGERIAFASRDFRRPAGRAKYDVVCANLVFDLLHSGSGCIVKLLKSPGVLLVAGILGTQFPRIRREYERCGLRLAKSLQENEWKSAVFVHPT